VTIARMMNLNVRRKKALKENCAELARKRTELAAENSWEEGLDFPSGQRISSRNTRFWGKTTIWVQ
jgi:hypothetical protein